MEIQFQQPTQHQKSSIPVTKMSKFKGKNKPISNNKYIGVRQRPSGRWVAEIKDTTQKIRMWLGTFETAEEAARAYDEAACLLRGSNTRTNFVTQVSQDSPLASRIRNLLNNKKGGKPQEPEENVEVYTPPTSTITTDNRNTGTSSSTSSSISGCPGMHDDNSNSNSNSNSCSSDGNDETQLFDDAYKPDLSNCTEELQVGSSKSGGLSWGFTPGFDRFSYTQEVLDFPKNMVLPETSDLQFSEFDRMKVERQISASLYAINGLQEYMETVHDPSEALWDLPPLCSLLS